ncbi:MAG: hypothetical protein LBU45_04060 [Azoarcus sp.]|jgi:hypothetical protein|nr:hypothetical protein [Azoarcus sp.]
MKGSNMEEKSVVETTEKQEEKKSLKIKMPARTLAAFFILGVLGIYMLLIGPNIFVQFLGLWIFVNLFGIKRGYLRCATLALLAPTIFFILFVCEVGFYLWMSTVNLEGIIPRINIDLTLVLTNGTILLAFIFVPYKLFKHQDSQKYMQLKKTAQRSQSA